MREFFLSNKNIDSIYFISDIHIDYQPNGVSVNNNKLYFDKEILRIKSDGIVILAGDFYDDYRKTLNLVKELEKLEVNGFFVLGNHDYWSHGEKLMMK